MSEKDLLNEMSPKAINVTLPKYECYLFDG